MIFKVSLTLLRINKLKIYNHVYIKNKKYSLFDILFTCLLATNSPYKNKFKNVINTSNFIKPLKAWSRFNP